MDEKVKKKKILVVDDDPKMRSVIRRLLSIEGKYEIEDADGFNANDKIKALLPDLVILESFSVT